MQNKIQLTSFFTNDEWSGLGPFIHVFIKFRDYDLNAARNGDRHNKAENNQD